MNDMNDKNSVGNSNANGPQRIELPGGGFGVYMGETGKEQTSRRKRPVRRHPNANHNGAADRRDAAGSSSAGNAQSGRSYPPTSVSRPRQHVPEDRSRVTSAPQNASDANRTGRHPTDERLRYVLSDSERLEIERRHAAARAKRRAAADGRISKYGKNKTAEPSIQEGIVKYVSYYFRLVLDRIYMTWMGITVDLDTVIKSLIIAGMILLFAILQTTVFSRFALFGATPDLMLALVVAIGSTEGERWGGATGLAAAFLIETLGGTGITLLPLLYVPVGYTVGVLSTGYLRDSALIRIIYTFSAGILRAIFTAIYATISFDKIDAGLLFTAILIPEYFSTAFMAILPHATEWFALKAFHKSREDRVS